MAFNGSQHAAALKNRYNQHQSIAKSRASSSKGVTRNQTLDGKNTHGALPKQGAPGTNKTQTIQKDINKSHGVPNYGSNVKDSSKVMQHGKTIK